MGTEPIDTTKAKMGRRKSLLFAVSRENTECRGPASAGSRRYPQDEWQQSLAESGNVLFFTVAFIPCVSTFPRGR